ncbi:polymorphic toxin-type HINT domain-containing protein [Micromonospora arborensis]|uniref:polymorphic toxin-type HINT domain-containing protein n=1 Tax=Micromonospora arborensis TaxID=2116518 RepID=UPI0033E9F9C3
MVVSSPVTVLAHGHRVARRGFRAVAAGLVLALAVQVAGAGVPAHAEVENDLTVAEIRDRVVFDLVEGGPSVKRAAETALLGSDQDARAYYETGYYAAQEADERAAVETLAGMDGPAVRAAALAVLDKSRPEIWKFVNGGFDSAWDADERLRVYRVLESGGVTVKAAAQSALDGGAEQIDQFLASGRNAAEHADDRLAATRMLAGAPNNSGRMLDLAAQAALQGTAEELKEFLRWGQFVARARDAELASIRSLTEQAKQASETTAREALAAEETSTRAGNAAAEAKRAALAAEAEARAAGGDARKASAAAGRAADAADGAAEAARDAVVASNAAMRAAQVAADASRKATTAAALTAQAASRAQKAAASARLNAGDARLAREAAEAARDAAARAQELAQVKAERDRALAKASAAAAAAKSASGNAAAAGVAADEAGRQSGVSAQQAQRARNAAAQARGAAASADRAADRAEALARQAKEASDKAFALAQSAAEHADNAKTQALAAADAADRAEFSAAESAKHAQAAVDAANVAVSAAEQAVSLEALARAEDEARLAEWTEQGVQQAQAALQAEQESLAAGGELAAWNRSLLWDTAEQDRIDAATAELLGQASTPGADAAVVLDRGRRAALALLSTGGEWTRQAARDALTGDEADMRLWLSGGRRSAAGQDDRARLWRLVDTLPDGAEKTAAQTALEGDDAAVETFLRTRNYAGKISKDRQKAYQILQDATTGVNLKGATERALAGTSAELHQFLRTGQHTARSADERLEAYRVMANGGPEVQAAAKVALAGPASQLSYFLSTGQFDALQRDQEQAAHLTTVKKLIAEAQQYAQTALEDADRAVEAAKRAQGYVNEANAAKARADKAAQQAVTFANQAAASAADAKRSADQAAASAVTARTAANRAQASASAAARSAATATAAAGRAQADARAAFQAKRNARASAEAAGKDAAAAAQAAQEATLIYLDRVKQAEQQRRSTEPGSGPDGNGTALDNHKTWGCLAIDPSSVSRECAKVFKDFADALVNKEKCTTPTSVSSTGCAMLGDLKQLIGENADVLMDMLQFTLMACGLVPGVGEACDVIDAGISFGRGDWVGGFLSGFAAVPLIGAAGTAGKAWKNSDKFRNIKNLIDKLRKIGSCPVPNSFTPGTRVLLADGRTKEIEQVHVGDPVLTTDPVFRRTASKPVTATISSAGTKKLVDVAIDEDGNPGTEPTVISATPGHLFWVPAAKAWVPAGVLTAGSKLLTSDGNQVTVTSISGRGATTSVHNLSVADLHTYYVLAGNTPVLVHNSGCWSATTGRAGDLAGKYKPGQSTRDPASEWYHEELSNDELLDSINNAADGDGIVVSANGTILGGHHRWDELQARIKDNRIDPDTEIRIQVYGGE